MRAIPVPPRLLVLLVLGVLSTAGSCSFSIGGLDYEALETAIQEELDTSYESIDRTVDEVSCPELADTPEPGDTLICTADLDEHEVRVEVTVEDEDFNVTFNTLDTVYDLNETAAVLAEDISTQVGTPVELDCGEGLAVIPVGGTFDCTAIDSSNQTATVRVTGNGPGDASWEIVEA